MAAVGYGVAAGLAALGGGVRLATFVADDPLGQLVRAVLVDRGLWSDAVMPCTATPRSVVLVAPDGSRMVSTDLRDMPDARYPLERFRVALAGASWAVVTNIGFARPLLAVAREAGVPIAADVQAIDDLHDAYNAEWMAAADVLFCSHERLPMAPEAWATAVHDTYGCRIVVVGMGADGALVKVAGQPARQVPAVAPRGVISTAGAGDTLVAGFLHSYAVTGDADAAIEAAVAYAGYKVGAAPGEDGFCSAQGLAELTQAAFGGASSPTSS